MVLVSEWDTKFGRTLPKLFRERVAALWCEARYNDVCADIGDPETDPETLDRCLNPFSCEWDKDHGASSWVRFISPTSSLPCSPSTQSVPCAPATPPSWVHSFSYMRGLDGASTGTGQAASDGALLKGGKLDLLAIAAGEDAGFKEPAIGTNQYDYLRRMTQQVVDLDTALKNSNRGAVRAFGILGTDYYDKLLILQALKERFPHHLYFTTDLDAGLLDAKVFGRTRNLIVAAPFALNLPQGLEVSPKRDIQGGFPPFRHSLQASLYITTLAVLAGKEAELAAEMKRPAAGSRLFEVGRHRFFPLRTLGVADDGLPVVHVPPHVRPEQVEFAQDEGAHPDSLLSGAWAYLRSHWIALLVVILTGPILASFLAPTISGRTTPSRAWICRRCEAILRLLGGGPPAAGEGSANGLADEQDRGGGWRAPIRWVGNHPVTAIAGIYLPLFSIMLWIADQGEEPFALMGGVSVWPSEVLRMVAGGAACWLLVHGWRQSRDADRRIGERFELRPESKEKTDLQHVHEDLSASDRPDESEKSIAAQTCRFFGQGDEADATAGAKSTSAASESEDSESDAEGEGSAKVSILEVWQDYRQGAGLRARACRVIPVALAFWLFSVALVYGLGASLDPYRGGWAYWFGLANAWLLAGFPFFVLLLAAVDEALLCSHLLQRLDGETFDWPIERYEKTGGCKLSRLDNLASARNYWLATELIAERTAPAAQVVHMPFVAILFLLVSLSTHFDNWSLTGATILLIGLSIAIALLAGARLRRTARRIRDNLLMDMKDEIAGIDYQKAEKPSDKLRLVVQRIEAIHEGAFTEWYNDPVFRALAWVLAIAMLIVTDYSHIAG